MYLSEETALVSNLQISVTSIWNTVSFSDLKRTLKIAETEFNFKAFKRRPLAPMLGWQQRERESSLLHASCNIDNAVLHNLWHFLIALKALELRIHFHDDATPHGMYHFSTRTAGQRGSFTPSALLHKPDATINNYEHVTTNRIRS